MRRFITIVFGLLMLGLNGCDGTWFSYHLPFPTPAQHDLVVLTTSGPLTYNVDDNGTVSGLEHDLIETLAQELGVGVQYIVVPPTEIAARSARGEGHIAMGWLPLPADPQQKVSPPIIETHDVLVQSENSLPINSLEKLKGRTVHALAASRQLLKLRKLQKTVPDLHIVQETESDILDLLENISEKRDHLVAIDSSLVDIATQFIPSLQPALELKGESPIVWWLGRAPNNELQARINSFVEKIQLDGTMARLEDRYYGHVRRLKQLDIIKFIGRTETVLPKLRRHFELGQRATGIDWRLLAAVAYQESQWETAATSPTGVRGIMMLTEDTADYLGVSNRLDPRESILAGARYLTMLKDQISADIREPDRTWLALAAYNIGPRHFNTARNLAREEGADPGAWLEMKRILPLLAQRKYYRRLKSSRARGGEAVILVENIRSYYDILVRNEDAYRPSLAGMSQMIGLNGKSPRLGLPPSADGSPP